MLHTEGVTSASIAGIVIAGFRHERNHLYRVGLVLAYIGEKRLMAGGGMVMAFCLIVIALRAPWPVEFVNFILLGFGFYMLHGCIPGLCHRAGAIDHGSAIARHSFFFFFLVRPAARGLWPGPFQRHRDHSGVGYRRSADTDGDGLDPAPAIPSTGVSGLAAAAIGRDT